MTSAGPLAGLTIVVTRAQAQSSDLADRLQALGSSTVSIATIEIVEPSDGGAALVGAVERLSEYAQVVVASPNGARLLAAAVAAAAPGGELPPVACVGPSTAAQLAGSVLKVNVVPDRAVAEGLIEVIPAPAGGGARLLLVQAEVARDVLEVGLGELGWLVDRVIAYRTVDGQVGAAECARARHADVITFTSSSTVERFVRLVGLDALPPVVASIGPITSQTARESGVSVDIEAQPHTIEGLVDAIVSWSRTRTR